MTDPISLYRRHGLARACDRFSSSPTILDLGCGFGIPVAAYLIGHGCRVTGIDTAPARLAITRSQFPSHDWRDADMRGLLSNITPEGFPAPSSCSSRPPWSTSSSRP